MKDLKSLLLLMLFPLCFISCGDDDNSEQTISENENAFIYGNEKFTVTQSIMWDAQDFDAPDGPYDDILIAFLNNATIDNSTETISGNDVSVVYFEVSTSTNGAILAGTFNYQENGPIETFDGQCGKHVNYGNNANSQFKKVTGGTLKVSNTTPLKYNYDVTLEDGTKIKGQFIGDFQYNW